MQPVKPQINVQSKKPAKLQSSYKKKDQVNLNQVSMKDYPKSKSSMYSDKNCKENINMWPEMSEMNMWLPKPAIT